MSFWAKRSMYTLCLLIFLYKCRICVSICSYIESVDAHDGPRLRRHAQSVQQSFRPLGELATRIRSDFFSNIAGRECNATCKVLVLLMLVYMIFE